MSIDFECMIFNINQFYSSDLVLYKFKTNMEKSGEIFLIIFFKISEIFGGINS